MVLSLLGLLIEIVVRFCCFAGKERNCHLEASRTSQYRKIIRGNSFFLFCLHKTHRFFKLFSPNVLTCLFFGEVNGCTFLSFQLPSIHIGKMAIPIWLIFHEFSPNTSLPSFRTHHSFILIYKWGLVCKSSRKYERKTNSGGSPGGCFALRSKSGNGTSKCLDQVQWESRGPKIWREKQTGKQKPTQQMAATCVPQASSHSWAGP